MKPLQLSKILLEHFMWLFWLHNKTNIHLDLRQVECYLPKLHQAFAQREIVIREYFQTKSSFAMMASLDLTKYDSTYTKYDFFP